jgi:cell division protein FtsA
MSAFGKTFVIFDIGSANIHSVVVDISSSDFEIISEFKYKSDGFSNGFVTDMNLFRKCISDLVYKTEQVSGFAVDKVILVLSGKYFFSEHYSAKLVLNGDFIKDSDILKVLNKSNQSTQSDIVIHNEIISYEIDEDVVVKDPVGMACETLKIKIHTIRAKIIPISNIISCFASINIEVEKILFSPHVAGFACATYSEDGDFISVDIGANLTKISRFIGNKMIDQKIIPFGGDAITNEISELAGVSKSQSERLKVFYGSAIFHPEDDQEILISTSINNESIQIQRSAITKVISNYLNNLTTSVKNSIGKDFYSCMIISGGSSLISGIQQKFYEIFQKNILLYNFKYSFTQVISSKKKSKTKAGSEIETQVNDKNIFNANVIGAIIYLKKYMNTYKYDKNTNRNKKLNIINDILTWIRKFF